jgi:hypothetical protein
VVGVPYLGISHLEYCKILPSPIATYLRIKSICKYTDVASSITPALFPNLQRFCLHLCQPHTFDMILRFNQVRWMNLRFSSHRDLLDFLYKCGDQSTQQLALSCLIIEAPKRYVYLRSLDYRMDRFLFGRQVEYRLLSLVGRPHLPQLRQVYISELFLDENIKLNDYSLEKGLALFITPFEST